MTSRFGCSRTYYAGSRMDAEPRATDSEIDLRLVYEPMDLQGFDAGSFDYVILSQTLQTMRHTEEIVLEMLRVGRQAIVTFPNFGHWQARRQVALGGRMPVSKTLPYQWYDTPNLHLCTVRDFEQFCADHSIRILERIVLHEGRRVRVLPNLLGSLAVFRFEKQH